MYIATLYEFRKMFMLMKLLRNGDLSMQTMYDVQQLLRKFGIFIYTGHRIGDIELMEFEMRNLYDKHMITIYDFQQAMLILRREKSSLHNE